MLPSNIPSSRSFLRVFRFGYFVFVGPDNVISTQNEDYCETEKRNLRRVRARECRERCCSPSQSSCTRANMFAPLRLGRRPSKVVVIPYHSRSNTHCMTPNKSELHNPGPHCRTSTWSKVNGHHTSQALHAYILSVRQRSCKNYKIRRLSADSLGFGHDQCCCRRFSGALVPLLQISLGLLWYWLFYVRCSLLCCNAVLGGSIHERHFLIDTTPTIRFQCTIRGTRKSFISRILILSHMITQR